MKHELESRDIVNVTVQSDYERSADSGAEGMFQIISISVNLVSGETVDITEKFDVGTHYYSLKDIAEILNVEIARIEEV